METKPKGDQYKLFKVRIRSPTSHRLRVGGRRIILSYLEASADQPVIASSSADRDWLSPSFYHHQYGRPRCSPLCLTETYGTGTRGAARPASTNTRATSLMLLTQPFQGSRESALRPRRRGFVYLEDDRSPSRLPRLPPNR